MWLHPLRGDGSTILHAFRKMVSRRKESRWDHRLRKGKPLPDRNRPPLTVYISLLPGHHYLPLQPSQPLHPLKPLQQPQSSWYTLATCTPSFTSRLRFPRPLWSLRTAATRPMVIPAAMALQGPPTAVSARATPSAANVKEVCSPFLTQLSPHPRLPLFDMHPAHWRRHRLPRGLCHN